MKECVTHHFACDCREEKFHQLERDRAELIASLASLLQCQGSDASMVTEGKIARARELLARLEKP